VILVLREVRGDAEVEQFVPGAAITFSFALLLASLAMFVAYINHMAQAIRPESIIDRVAAETMAMVTRRPELAVQPADTDPAETDPIDTAPIEIEPIGTVCSSGGGVLQTIEVDRLVRTARHAEVAVVLCARIGDFVPQGSALFRVHACPPGRTGSVDDGLERHLRSCVSIGRDRTMQQDVAFGIRQLVDVAIRALSPSINDPTTAVQVIDLLHTVLGQLGTRDWPAGVHADDDGNVRVVLDEPGWSDFVELAMTELRQYGGGSVQVLRRLHHALDDLSASVGKDLRPALREQATLLRAAAERSLPDAADRDLASKADAQGLGSTRSDRSDPGRRSPLG
jgi:uncharacterized membrane protein